MPAPGTFEYLLKHLLRWDRAEGNEIQLKCRIVHVSAEPVFELTDHKMLWLLVVQ